MKKYSYIILSFTFFIALCHTTLIAQPIAQTSCGQIQGIWLESSMAAFLGIPYASPPVGERRFAPPAALNCWSGRATAQSRK